MTISAALAALAVSATADAACARSSISAPTTISVQGATLPYVRCGEGAPTIVFEGGFGGNLQNWSTLLPMIGEFAPVFAYSRPGFRGTGGTWSADADGVRTSDESARLLRELLLKAGVQPPYLLVGHSLGGLYVQKFAQLFPAETTGLVLLDNRPATFMAQCKSMKLSECLGATVSPAWSEPLKRTFVGITPSEAAAPTPAQLGAIPVLVLAAGRPEDGVGPRFFEEITKAQAQFAGALRRGRHKVVANATHSSLSSDQARETAAEIRRFWDDLNKRR